MGLNNKIQFLYKNRDIIQNSLTSKFYILYTVRIPTLLNQTNECTQKYIYIYIQCVHFLVRLNSIRH
jgi:hypothetical protein